MSATPHDPTPSDDAVDAANELSRRAMLGLGLAAAAGGTALALGGAQVASAQEASAVLAATQPGLSYLGYDAFAFFDDQGERLYQSTTGTQRRASSPLGRIWAPLNLPAGTIIKEISASYQGQPIVQISRRPFYDTGQTALDPSDVAQVNMPASSGGPRSATISLSTPVVVQPGFTYTVNAFLSSGVSIIGVRLGYQGGYVPFTGANPRVLDTRTNGGKLNVNTPRKVSLGLPGRAAIFNLTATEGEGAGNIAAYAGNVSFPGNSSVNFRTDRNTANLVICAMDSSGAINLRAAFSRVHAIVDLVGSIV